LIGSGGTLHEPSDDTIYGRDGTDVINSLNQPAAKALVACGDGFDRVIVDRKDMVAADGDRVFVGLGSINEFEESIPESFLEGQPPFFSSKDKSKPRQHEREEWKGSSPAGLWRSFCSYSPECVEEEFSEVRLHAPA
jgi:hypothetical protein